MKQKTDSMLNLNKEKCRVEYSYPLGVYIHALYVSLEQILYNKLFYITIITN